MTLPPSDTQPRLFLSMNEMGEPDVELLGPDNNVTVMLEISDNRPQLYFEREGEVPFLLSSEPDLSSLGFQGPSVNPNEKNLPLARFNVRGVNTDRHGELSLGTLASHSGVRAGVDEQGNSYLALLDQQGRERVQLGVGASGAGYVQLLDEKGKSTWEAK